MNKKVSFFLILVLLFSIGVNFYFFYFLKEGKMITENKNIINNKKKVNNIKEISNIKKINKLNNVNIKEYKKNSFLPESILFYSIKNNDINKWNLYWSGVYGDFKNVNFSKNDFSKNLNNIFIKIVNNNLALSIKNKYLLDGGIFFSSGTMKEKINGCNEHHKISRKNSDFQKYGLEIPKNIEDNIRKCINFSYYYEALIQNDNILCNNINDDGTGNSMKKDCIELLDNN